MEGINISYFMNGAAFMFFGYVSFRLLTHRPRSRIQRILGLTLAFWALLEFKDILLYFPSLKTERLVNSLLFIDGINSARMAQLEESIFTSQSLSCIYNCLFVHLLCPYISFLFRIYTDL